MAGRRLLVATAVLALSAGAAVTAQATGALRPVVLGDGGTSPARCAPGDPNTEPGVQGDVPRGLSPAWDCGVREIGTLPGAGGPMAVAGTCAYTGTGLAGGAGVRVLDVSDPRAPRLVRTLDTSSRELLAARVADDRAVLVTRRRDPQAQQGQVLGRDMLVDVWDIADCTDPQLRGTLRFPTTSAVAGDPPGETGGPAHNLALDPTATRVYGSLPLQEADISDLSRPETWTVRDLHCLLTEQHYPPYVAAPGLCASLEGQVPRQPQIDHEPVFRPDGSRLYVGAQLPGLGSNAMWVVDMTQEPPRVVSVTDEQPGHSIDLATVDGREYLLHSNEIGGTACVPEALRPRYVGMGDRAWLLDVTDETAPSEAAEIVLADSTFDHCGRGGNTGGPSTAYHDVDDTFDSTYAVIGFGSAGFRFFDLRDPAAPVEVGYFNHGASEHTKPYVVPRTGHVWVSDARGFSVLELEPHLRRHLGLRDVPVPSTPAACVHGGWRDHADESGRPFPDRASCQAWRPTPR